MTHTKRGLNHALHEALESLPAASRFLGKQPILSSQSKVFGHELLFRAGLENAFSGDEEEATRQVIDGCLFLFPHDVKAGKMFVNCTRESLLSGIVTLLPPAHTVLEVLENVDVDAELLACCRDLKERGYCFALDDFTPHESKKALLEIAGYIKVDFRATDAAGRLDIYKFCRGHNLTFIAEKIQTAADFAVAQKEGCTLHQGYYFSKPTVSKARVIPQNHLVHVQLLAALSQSPADLGVIERLVMADSSICYRLLRLVNSAWFGVSGSVTSVRSALVMVGDDEIRHLVTVSLVRAFMGTGHHALLAHALERAKLCELLAPTLRESAAKLYLIGMLSVMDTFLGIPMQQVVQHLPIEADMKAALLGQAGPLATGLDIACRQQTGEYVPLPSVPWDNGLTDGVISKLHLQSVYWANTMMSGMD